MKVFFIVFGVLLSSVFADELAKFSEDFASLKSGETPEEFLVIDGEFTRAQDGENAVLSVSPTPLVEGGFLAGPVLKETGKVSARFKSPSKRRSFPRFGVGLHGMSGYRLRVVPAKKKIEILRKEEMVAEVDIVWKSDVWVEIKLSVTSSNDSGWKVEGWMWEADQKQPEAPMISLITEEKPGSGKASFWATPYTGLPIMIDQLAISQ